MHPKMKSTLSGLFVVAAFVAASALLGEPLRDPALAPAAGDPPATRADAADTLLAAQRAAREGNRRRLHLTMPYVSVGQLVPRVGES